MDPDMLPEDEHLAAVARWAGRIRTELRPLLARRLGEVHFRPSSTGIAMVGLRADRPQRGRSGITSLERLVATFDDAFIRDCVECSHGRATPEKALQSFLIADAYRHDGMMDAVNIALAAIGDPTRLELVTDEITVPTPAGKVVCDLLALHRSSDGDVPVVIELKSARDKARLIAQVETYAAFVDAHAAAYEALYAALLGRPVEFRRATERWIVWPAAGAGPDRHEAELGARGIRMVTYGQGGDGYTFRVGAAPGA